MPDFTLTPQIREMRQRVRSFMTGGLEKMGNGIKDCIDFKSNTVCQPFT